MSYRGRHSSYFVGVVAGLACLSAVLSGCDSVSVDSAVGTAGPGGPTVGDIGNSALKITPDKFDFGLVAVLGAPAQLTLSLVNVSPLPIYVQSVLGSADPNFKIVSSTCPPGSSPLTPASSCNAIAQFQPLVGGQLTYKVTAMFGTSPGDGHLVDSVTLVGTGIAPVTFAGVNPIDPAKVSTTKATLTWPATAGASSFAVYKAVTGNTLALDGYIGASAVSYVVQNLIPATGYTFRVNAINELGQPDGNTDDQTATTDSPGAFAAPAALTPSEGSTVTSGDLGLSCTDSKGHYPSFLSLTGQSDPDAQCVLLTSPYRVQCSPNYKPGHSNWSSTLTLSCLLNDYPTAFTRTLAVNVTHTNRPPVMSSIGNQSILAGQPIAPVSPVASDPNGYSVSFTCQYDNLADGSVGAGAASCATLLNQDGSNAAFNTSTGVFAWTAPLSAAGTPYEVRITANNGNLCGGSACAASSVFVVNVGTPPPDPAHSTVTVSVGSVGSGSPATVTLHAKDVNGNVITKGGSTVIFSASGGTSTGTFSAVSDNGDGTYSAVFTGVLAGSATTIHATAQGSSVTTALPTVTVTPGPISTVRSTISASGGTVSSGSTLTVSLTAKDAAGNLIPTGGQTVVFGRTGGTSTGTFSPSPATDNGNGTYAATFTGITAGTATTLTATIGGSAVTSASPAVTVNPGPASLSQSSLAVTGSPSVLQSGSNVAVTLTARDVNGNRLNTGGLAVVFGTAGGSSTGAFSSVLDNSDGTYSTTFTGAVAGTAINLGATIGGLPITSTLPSLSVIPGPPSVSQSVVTAVDSALVSGNSTTLTLTTKDANGNALPTGGAIILFSISGGTSSGSISAVVDHNNGTYTASFTATTAGSASTIGATIGGATVTGTLPQITVSPGPLSLTTSVVSVSAPNVLAGQAVTLTFRAKDLNGNNLATGGRTVIFTQNGGTSVGTISPSPATDNGNGTYSATFTGTISGTATSISATSDGSPLASAPAPVSVVPANLSLSKSTLTVSQGTIASGGTANIILTARDGSGNSLAAGGLTVTFGTTGGTSAGTFSAVSDHGDGTYTTTFTGITAGSASTFTATIGGGAVTNTLPAITVTPGAVSLPQSTVTTSGATVASGSTVTLTLHARDSNGNSLGAGGKTVVFTRSGGTSTGTISSVTDNLNGDYTATFTGIAAGTATTVSATIDGAAVTSALPTITVTPGALSLSQSTVSASASNVASGSTVNLTVTAKDANGNSLGTGGQSVTLGRSGGTSTGNFSAVTDNGNGTYTATFTAVVAGTATTVTAMIGGLPVTSVLPTITVGPGPLSLSQSTISVAPSSVASGGTVAVTLTAKDANGNVLGSGGRTVVFSRGGGTSTGSFSAVTDNGNGTYSATFTSAAAGTATAISATIDGATVASASPTITVTPGAISLSQSTLGVSSGSIASGTSTTLTVTTRDANGNSMGTGGKAVTFARSGGTSAGNFSAVTDNGNGTYTATFTGTTSGTAATITASVDGSALTSAAPAVTVVPGAVSLAQSTVSVSAGTIASGANVTLTLTAKDAAGNLIGAGGETVVFARSGGVSSGNITATTDHSNGTYTATFTGTTAGTATTITATIGGAAVTSSLPTVTVIPGTISLLQSTVTIAGGVTFIASGANVAVTLTTRDANGNQLSAGGQTVAFTATGGTSTGAFGALTDNNDGTYTTLYTGAAAGTAKSIGATIGSGPALPITSVLPTLSVVPGAVSTSVSVLAVGSGTVASGVSTTLTLTAKDANGNVLTAGGLSVGFNYTGGTSTGGIGAVSDNHDGTYTATFTGILAGTATTITATIGGLPVTSVAPTVTVTPGAVSLAQSTVTVSAGAVVSGNNVTLTLTAKDTNGNQLSGGGLTVVFGTSGGTSTGAISSVSDHTNGTYTATFTGMVAGTATTITATIGGNTVTTTMPTVSVSVGAISLTGSTLTLDTSSLTAGNTGTLTLTLKDAYGNRVYDSSQTANLSFSVQSSGTSSGTIGAITALNGGGNDGIYQASFTGTTAGTTNAIKVVWNQPYFMYSTVVTQFSPMGYWKLSEAGGTTATDFMGLNNATYTGAGYTFGLTGPIPVCSDTAVNLNGSASYAITGNTTTLNPTSALSISAWVRLTATNANNGILQKGSFANSFGDYDLALNSANIKFNLNNAAFSLAGPALALNQWTHVVATYDGTTARIYTNGALVASAAYATPVNSSNSPLILGGYYNTPYTLNGGLGEVAIFNYALSSAQVTALHNSNGAFAAQPSFIVSPNAPTAAQSTVAASPTSLTADGSTPSTVTVTVKDAYNNPVPNKGITLVSSRGASDTITPASGVTNASGQVLFAVKSAVAGSSVYTATETTDSFTITQTASVTFNVGPVSLSNSTFTLNNGALIAGNTGTLTLTLKDAYGNQIPDSTQAGSLFFSVLTTGTSSGTIGAITPVGGNAGAYQATLTGTTAGTTNKVRANLSGTYRQAIITDAPISYWRLDETAGPTAVDTMGHQNGTYSGTLSYGAAGALSGDTDTAALFGGDAASAKVSLGTLAIPQTTSVEAWLKTTTALGQTAVISNFPGANSDWFGVNGSKIGAYNNAWCTGTGITVNDGIWHHLVWTSDGSTTKMYVDGGFDRQCSVSRPGSSYNGLIAYDGGSAHYTPGSIDEVAIYNYVLTPAQITAHYNAGATSGTVFSNTPSFTVTPNIATAAQSLVAASPSTVTANGIATSSITVTVRDAYNNPIPSKTVTLISNRGASDTITPASGVSNASGQVVFTVSSALAGSSIYTATDTTDTLPVTATATVTYAAGAVSPTIATVTASPTSNVLANNSTTSTITVTLLDANSNAVPGKTVSLASSRAASDTVSAPSGASDANGRVTFTVKSHAAGTSIYTATDVTDANLVISQTPSVGYVAGPASQTVSTVASAPSSVPADGATTSTITVTLLDANSNPVSGKTVTLASGRGGTDTIAPASASTNASGVATFTVRSSTSGSAVLTATDTSDSFAISQTPTVFFVGTPVLTVASNKLYPLDGSSPPAQQGQNYTLTSSATNPNSSTILYGCTVQTVDLNTSDPGLLAAGTSCVNLPSLAALGTALKVSNATFNTGTGSLVWQPTNTQRGTYKFTITATDQTWGTSDTKSFFVTVRENFATTNLLAGLDAQVSEFGTSVPGGSTAAAPRTNALGTNSATDWLGLIGAQNGVISGGLFSSATPWLGTGSYASPYQLTFNGTSDSMSLGSVLSSATTALFSTWIKPASVATTGSVILGDGGVSGNGFVLRQSVTDSGKLDLIVGQPKTYPQVILGDAPVAYWRLNETSGTTAVDQTGTIPAATYYGTYTRGVATPLVNSPGAAVTFDGSSGYIANIGDANTYSFVENTGAFALEVWVKTPTLANDGTRILMSTGSSVGKGFYFYRAAGTYYISGKAPFVGVALAIPDLNWHHVVLSGDGTNTRAFLDGVQVSSSGFGGAQAGASSGALNIARGNWGGNYAATTMAEVAIYNYGLTAAQISAHYKAGKGTFYPNATAAYNPILYYRLGEKAGSIAYDSSATGNNGTYAPTGVTLGATGGISGDPGTAAAFAGTDTAGSSYVVSNAGITTTAGISISAWVKWNTVTGGSYDTIFNTMNATVAGYTWLAENNGMLYWQFADSTGPNFYNQAAVGWASPTVGTWYHLTLTHDYASGMVNFYANGARIGSSVATGDFGVVPPSNKQAYLGSYTSNAIHQLPGVIQDVAVFDYALAPAQIANIYNNSKFAHCRSRTSFANGIWSAVAGLFDGSNLSLIVNGQPECTITPSATFNPPATALRIGATDTNSNYWAGSIADTKVYGAVGSLSVGATDAKTNFDASANRFRATPVENIVTSGLVLNLDAANAKQGLGTYATGCAATDLNWTDLSGSFFTGGLYGFSSCGTTSGWNGAGTTADPYRLDVNGTSNYVSIADNPALRAQRPMTAEGWFKRRSTGVNDYIFNQRDSSGGWSLVVNSSNQPTFVFYSIASVSSTATVTDTNWHHLAATVDNAGLVTLYLDGTSVASNTISAPNVATNKLYMAAAIDSSGNIAGYSGFSLAAARIYNRALSANEIQQNFNAQAHRFMTSYQSCQDAYNHGNLTDGVYMIDPDGDGLYSNYCKMSGGYGWTLVMKTSVDNSDFYYSSANWTSSTTLNPLNFDLTTSGLNAKYQSFIDLPITSQIMVVINGASAISTLNAPDRNHTLQWIINNTAETRHSDTTENLLDQTSSPWGIPRDGSGGEIYSCQGVAFNFVSTNAGVGKVRVGLATDNITDCSQPGSGEGFGLYSSGAPYDLSSGSVQWSNKRRFYTSQLYVR